MNSEPVAVCLSGRTAESLRRSQQPAASNQPRPKLTAAVARLRQLDRIRQIHVRGQLTTEKARNICAQIGQAAKSFADIELRITSNGGENGASAAICRALEASRKLVHVIVEDRCDSAAIDILATGHLRSAMPGARLIIHRGSAELKGTQIQRLGAVALRRIADELEGPDLTLLRTLRAIGCPLPLAMERKYLQGKDVILSASEAREIGLLHYIEENR